MSKSQPSENLVGKKFGLLIVLEHKGRKQYKDHKHHIWLCKCECGKEKIIAEQYLKSGRLKSCGCLGKLTGNKNPLYKGYKDISGRAWHNIKHNAKRRQLDFDITIEYAWDLFIKQDKKCALSKIDIEFAKSCQDHDEGGATASLDRIDSKLGYIKSNIQWLHKTINRMKWDLNQDQFISLCDAVHHNKYLHKQTRPNWVEYYINIAKEISQRSHDSQTRHGCVVTSEDNLPLGFGYNAFPRKMKDDTKLPNTRPNKYDYIIHAEVNAISNCVIKPKNGIVYITGEPCNNCLMHMWQNGIVKVFYLDAHGTFLWGEAEKDIRKIFVEQSGIELIKVTLDVPL